MEVLWQLLLPQIFRTFIWFLKNGSLSVNRRRLTLQLLVAHQDRSQTTIQIDNLCAGVM
jgi:hypothetical protein